MQKHIDKVPVISEVELKRLADWLKDGKIIAFPTETVYGLGVDAANSQAVQSLYDLKLRSADKPLSLMVDCIATARDYVAYWPDIADKLARTFWPGPLSLVLRKSRTVPTGINPEGNTVGLRCPAHSITLQLLAYIDFPVATTSANYSGGKALISFDQVRGALGKHSEIEIIDGGKCCVGVESSVVDLTQCGTLDNNELLSQQVVWLRSGAVTRDQIDEVLSD